MTPEIGLLPGLRKEETNPKHGTQRQLLFMAGSADQRTTECCGKLELTAFHEPTRAQDQTGLPANAHGYRHTAYRVTNINAVVARAREAGYHSAGDVVDYQDSDRLAHIRGPEGLIVEVAELLPSASTSV